MEIAELYELYKQHPVVTTDSRDCPPGAIFFALKGASFNGNAFAAKAIERGCAYAVVDEVGCVVEGDERYILVGDVLKTLQELAHFHREQFKIPVIEVTGTNGKTTTKELMAAVLSKKHHVLYTQGNLNNHIGVPKTLLRLTPEHTIAVIETGANHPGEIKTLAEIVDPDFGIITNVWMAHLEGFGSFEGVVRTKGELYDYLRAKHGTVFIDHDSEVLKRIADGLHQIFYGSPCDEVLSVEGEVIECAPFLKFRWRQAGGEWHIVQTRLIGAYNVKNLLAAATVGRAFGVTVEQVNEALKEYKPTNDRSQLTETEHNKLIVDAYNANPTSMRAAIENFRDMKVEHRMAILGDMGELGESSWQAHQDMVDLLVDSGIEQIWLVGPKFKSVHHPFRTFDDVEQVKRALERKKPEGYYILIKGSHSTRLYELPKYL
ncbi:MAG: UDP-N-acetylmuramoyl-tripeptide--D-alanyl-D-alanine ligase [Paraprevotella sp.]|nr:UDP-N-acetylmuramoyl-tripeptide--D-alanyl-D-alanine ligase [Paraprevotella sp.]